MKKKTFPLVDAAPEQRDAGERCSVAVGSALVRAAKKRRCLADKVNAADREYGELLAARYGWRGEELDDELVEVIDYGNGMNQSITLRWLDEQMAKIGLKPNNKVRDARAESGASPSVEASTE